MYYYIYMYAKDLKKDVLSSRVFSLKGNDLYWLDYARNFFIELTDKDNRDVNIRIFNQLDSLADVIYAVTSFSFSRGNQLIIVKDNKYKPKKDELKVLTQTIQQGIEPYIILFENVDFLGAAQKKLITEIDCGKLKKYDLFPLVEDIFKDYGGIERSAAFLLIDYTAGDMAKIYLESQKLIAYAEKNKVTDEMVETLVTEDSEIQIFHFVNSLVEGRQDKALKILDKLMVRGESKNFLLASLIRQYRRMLHSAISPKSNEELGKLLNVKPYAIKKSREIRSLNKLQMKKTMDMLVDYEYKFKSGQMSLD
ncbi:MAG: DNA polymerase III subunit delta, partial [Bacillota bacterium]